MGKVFGSPVVVTREQLLEYNAEADLTGNETKSGGNYSLIVSCTAYWEWKRENGSTWATNPNGGFYLDTPYFAQISAGVDITYDDGSVSQVFIDIKAAINSSGWH